MGGCIAKRNAQVIPLLGETRPVAGIVVERPFASELPRNVDEAATFVGADPHVQELSASRETLLSSECFALRTQLEESRIKIENLESSVLRLTQSLNSFSGIQDSTTKDSSSLDLNEEREDEENIKSFFGFLANGQRFIQKVDIENARTELKNRFLRNDNTLDEWARLAVTLESEIENSLNNQGVDYDKFNHIMMTEIPKMPGRVHWACSLRLGNVLAKHLKPGTVFDGQQGIKEMTEADINAACAAFLRQAPAVILDAWRSLRGGKNPSAEDANSKFAMTEGAYTGRFATLDDFYRGVEYRLGQPNPKLFEGMRNEHCARPNAATWFLAPNYGLCSKARWEWQWTVGAEEVAHADLRERLGAHGGKYPGETGDRCSQASVRIFVKAVAHAPYDSGVSEALPLPSAIVERLNQELKVNLESEESDFLEAGEERVRGVTIAETARIRGAGVDMTLILPFGAAGLTVSRVEILKQAVGYACGMEAAFIAISEVVDKTWEYCRFTSETRMRSAIDKLIVRELPSAVTVFVEELGLDPDRASACVTAAKEAQSLGRSNDATVLDYLTAVGAEADGLRALIKTLVDGFGEQTRQWAARRQHRKQGRCRDGSVASLITRHDVQPVVTKAQLRSEEFTALRLYTGPLYIVYNAVMRDFPTNVVNSLAGNKFETTVFVIVSGITKLANVTPVPPRRMLYRGLGGMLLPEQFWKKTAQGFLGGVELGLMSTTADRRVAIQYSGHEKKRAMMLEIQAGRIDVGASLGFLSQYASEEEFLMQPLSCLEVRCPALFFADQHWLSHVADRC